MSTAYYHFNQHFAHDTGDEHPEHAMRIMAIEQALQKSGLWDQLTRIAGIKAHLPDIHRAHSPGYVEQLQLIQPQQGHIYVDEDTPMSTGSLEAAMYSAGSCTQALDDIMSGLYDNAFIATRPPGHHAERKRSMGFCFFNNIAVTALRAADVHHLQRIAVLDFDAHQGNGTVDILQNDERFLVCSSFQHPFYPYSHYQSNRYGNLVNALLPTGAGSQEFRNSIRDSWQEPLRRFAPELILVSAGFDGHLEDPMAELCLTDSDYGWVAHWIDKYAKERNIPWLAALEGGYHLNALGRSVDQFINAMLGNPRR